jgi:ABC-2 type transport system permease protein
MTTGGESARAQRTPSGVVVLEQELRDLWLGGRGLLLSVGFSLLLSVIAYLTATNKALNFL